VWEIRRFDFEMFLSVGRYWLSWRGQQIFPCCLRVWTIWKELS